MTIKKIAEELIKTSKPVHDAQNVELQNWTNSLTDGQINSLWRFARKNGLRTYKEGHTRFIAQADLERLIARKH